MFRAWSLSFLFFFFTLCTVSCKENAAPGKITDDVIRTAPIPADRYGADAYGMKKYVLVFLKRGPNPPADSTEAARLQQAHMANISRLADEGTLVLAGPFLEDGDLRGLYLFDVPTVEEARRLTESDPAVKAGSLRMELKSWYGSAALVAIPALHKKLESMAGGK